MDHHRRVFQECAKMRATFLLILEKSKKLLILESEKFKQRGFAQHEFLNNSKLFWHQDFSKQGHRVDIKTLFPDMITDFRSVFLKKNAKNGQYFC